MNPFSMFGRAVLVAALALVVPACGGSEDDPNPPEDHRPDLPNPPQPPSPVPGNYQNPETLAQANQYLIPGSTVVIQENSFDAGDSGTLTIGEGSKLIIEHDGSFNSGDNVTIIVKPGGLLEVRDGGNMNVYFKLSAEDGSVIRVLKDGYLRVDDGVTLKSATVENFGEITFPKTKLAGGTMISNQNRLDMGEVELDATGGTIENLSYIYMGDLKIHGGKITNGTTDPTLTLNNHFSVSDRNMIMGRVDFYGQGTIENHAGWYMQTGEIWGKTPNQGQIINSNTEEESFWADGCANMPGVSVVGYLWGYNCESYGPPSEDE